MSDAIPSGSVPPPPAAGPVARRLRSCWIWSRTHRIRAILLVLSAYVLIELLTIPWLAIPRLKSEQPGETALMRQRKDEAEDAGKKLAINQRWISLARLPAHVTKAVVVAEDGTFYEHGGIDWFEVQESIQKNVRERRAARGASTITQQLAKNLYLSTSKTPMRKVKEIIITLLLERALSKSRILELYLNVIEFGSGVFGIEAAARTYFGKSASALTLDEAVRLAAVIPRPLRSRPDQDSRYVLRMKRIILARLAARNGIPETMEEDTSGVAADEPAEGTDSTDSEEDGSNGL
jgi:monofunctional biosynthetic peptidoglycan transglycosylase